MKDYEPQKMAQELLCEDKEMETYIDRALEKAKKERDKKPQPKVTRLVDRKGDDMLDESYHEQMQELARQSRQEEGEECLPDDVEHF